LTYLEHHLTLIFVCVVTLFSNPLATAESQLRPTLRTAEFCVSVYFWESTLK